MGFINQQGMLNNLNSMISYVSSEDIPVNVTPQVVPVLDINPLANPIANVVGALTGSTGTILTTDKTLSFYLTFLAVSLTNTTGGGGYLQIKGYVGGVQQTLIQMPYWGTALGLVLQTTLTIPVAIDKGTALTFVDSGGSAVSPACSIMGLYYNANQTGQQQVNY